MGDFLRTICRRGQRKPHTKLFPEHPGAAHYMCMPMKSDGSFPAYLYDSAQCIEVITNWVQECMQSHAECSIHKETETQPKRLVYIGNRDEEPLLRLIETTGEHVPYYALSHCWGKGSVLKTTKKSLKKYRRKIPWSRLSYTFRDFLQVTMRLRAVFGVHHVWIDSLCIVQDDRADRQHEIANMDSIFANADLVVAATSAFDGNAGFFQPRSEPIKTFKEIIRPDWVSNRSTEDGYAHDLFKREPAQGNYGVGWAMHDNPVFLRAWCLQERLIATRVLHFTRGEMVFECRSDVRCECNAFERRREWLLDVAEKVDFDHFITHQTLGTPRSWDNWWYFVESFSRRYVTEPTDKLPALAGAARRVARAELGSYLAGMWREGLELNLIWRVERGYYSTWTRERSKAPYVAPSWSWASLPAGIAVQWRQNYSSKRAYPRKIVAKVVEADCTPSTWDPYAQVLDGFLLIHGYTIDVSLHKEEHRLCGYQTRWASQRDSEIVSFYPDTDLSPSVKLEMIDFKCLMIAWEMETHHGRNHGEESVIPQAYEFETLTERRVWRETSKDHYTTYYYWALVLQPVKEQKNTYRRIGIDRVSGETWAPLIEDGWEKHMETLRLV